MALLKIIKYPDPILSKRASPVKTVTTDVGRLVNDMFETMYAAQGVGLAAPQVGVSLRVLVIDADQRKLEMINPVISKCEDKTEREEGCLSIPEFRLVVERSSHVTVEYKDKTGGKKTLTAEGLLAAVIQHEIDHLNGRLLIDRVSRLKRDLYLEKLKKYKTT